MAKVRQKLIRDSSHDGHAAHKTNTQSTNKNKGKPKVRKARKLNKHSAVADAYAKKSSRHQHQSTPSSTKPRDAKRHSAHDALLSKLVETKNTKNGNGVTTIPESIEDRLALFAPIVAAKVARMGDERVTVYHGANAAPADYNPVLVNVNNVYCVTEPGDFRFALRYMSGEMDHGDTYTDNDEDSRLHVLRKSGHRYYGFVAELSLPPEITSRAYEVDNDVMVNDLLFTKRIGTYNLEKLARAKTRAEEEASIEWFSTNAFVRKFISPGSVDALLHLQRSGRVSAKDCDEFAAIKSREKREIAAKGIAEVKGLFCTEHDVFAMHTEKNLFFAYLDKEGTKRVIQLDEAVEVRCGAKSQPFNRSMLASRGDRIALKLGAIELPIGKRPGLPTKAADKTPVSFAFELDRAGDLRVVVAS